jgi:hypothetical protein
VLSLQGQMIAAWGAVAQWNLEPGEEEEDGECGMDLFEFWVTPPDADEEELEYAFECDGSDALFLKTAFELHMQQSNKHATHHHSHNHKNQRVIV